jgi:2-amino-4-hydroxy-6-hydroxymethyldihydropteridine diphosphokinase
MSEASRDADVARRVFLGMGSNVGDRQRFLTDAIDSLTGVVAVSPVYETDPVGGPPQDAYLNVVVELATSLGPRQLLGIAHRLESAAGRVRTEHWGPRTLDVDVLLVGDLRLDEPDLVVPHPRMWERRFVLAPLSDLAPELVSERLLAQSDGRVSVVGTLDLPRRLRRGPLT